MEDFEDKRKLCRGLRELRKKAGLTQHEMAIALSCDLDTVGSLERGEAPQMRGLKAERIQLYYIACQNKIDEETNKTFISKLLAYFLNSGTGKNK
jgi:transcriptional regulator with XRE-family HTH domain